MSLDSFWNFLKNSTGNNYNLKSKFKNRLPHDCEDLFNDKIYMKIIRIGVNPDAKKYFYKEIRHTKIAADPMNLGQIFLMNNSSLITNIVFLKEIFKYLLNSGS